MSPCILKETNDIFPKLDLIFERFVFHLILMTMSVYPHFILFLPQMSTKCRAATGTFYLAVIVEHLISKPQALICCFNSLRSSGKAVQAGILSHSSTRAFSEVGHGWWTMRPGSTLVFQFIPMALDGVRSELCVLGNHFFMDISLCAGNFHVETRKVSDWSHHCMLC